MKAITLRVYESRFLFLLSKFSRVLVAKLLEQGYPPFRFLMNPPSTMIMKVSGIFAELPYDESFSKLTASQKEDTDWRDDQ